MPGVQVGCSPPSGGGNGGNGGKGWADAGKKKDCSWWPIAGG